MIYEVWVEGYWCNGDRGQAWLKGKVEADSFNHAIDILFATDPNYNIIGHWWGSRIFDNEIDARRSFG